MTSSRSLALQDFLDSVAAALQASSMQPDAARSIDRVYAALATTRPAGAVEPRWLPVCEHLDDALSVARTGSVETVRVASTLAALAPSLAWAPRASGGAFASQNWPEGHANTMIVGPHGLEDRQDVYVGAMLLAPHVRYPDHTHPPEEVYYVMTPGQFQHGNSDWFEPGIGGTLHNSPGTKHAVASGAEPLLAVWCLWTGQPA